jgi:hypothetical protein
MGVICHASFRLGLEEAETVRASTLEFGVWLCGITFCKRQARSGKTEALRATAYLLSGWVGGIFVS